MARRSRIRPPHSIYSTPMEHTYGKVRSTPLSFRSPTGGLNYDEALFRQKYQSLEDEVRRAYMSTVKQDHHVASRIFEARSYLDLNELPRSESERLMKEFKDLIGFTRELSIGGRPADTRWFGMGSRTGTPYSTFDVTTNGGPLDPKSYIWQNLNLQFKRLSQKKLGARNLATGNYDIGKRLPKLSYAQSNINLINNMVSSGGTSMVGKNVFLFDLETMGLDLKAGIHQFSGYDLRLGGDIARKPTFDFHLRTPMSQVGMLSHEGKPLLIEDWMRRQGARFADEATVGSGDVLFRTLKPALERMAGSDFVAGHNVSFDIEHLFSALFSSTVYHKDASAKALIDNAFARATSARLDTRDLARSYFAARGEVVPVARELRFEGKNGAFSMENLLLHTNLAEHAGPDFRDFLMGSSVHNADVDTFFEAHLLNAMTAGTLKTQPMEDIALRHSILRGFAPTPVSKVMNPEYLTDDILRRAIEERGKRAVEILPNESVPRRYIDKLFSEGRTDDIINLIRRAPGSPGGSVYSNIHITPLEQEIFHTRTFGGRIENNAENLLFRFGHFDEAMGRHRLTDRFLNRNGTINKFGVRPDFGAIQKELADRGIAFSGLSMPERLLGTVLAESTASMTSSTIERKVAGIAKDLNIGLWNQVSNPYIGPSNISLPYKIVEDAIGKEKLNRSLRVSPFKTAKGEDQVNLVYQFNGRTATEQREAVKGKIRELIDTGDDETLYKYARGATDKDVLGLIGEDEMMPPIVADVATKYRSGLQEVLEGFDDVVDAQGGIGIGHFGGQGATTFRSVYDQVLGQIGLTDSQVLPFAVHLTEANDSRNLRTAGFVLDRYMNTAEKTAYGSEAEAAMTQYNSLLTWAKTSGFGKSARLRMAEMAVERDVGPVVQNLISRTEPIIKRAPIVAGIAAIGLGAYYKYRKHKRQAAYDETIEPQAYEPYRKYNLQNQVQARLAEGSGSYAQRPDPLATAGLVQIMNSNKIGHTSMSNTGKNSSLFGGVL